jgi:hypothetical protein
LVTFEEIRQIRPNIKRSYGNLLLLLLKEIDIPNTRKKKLYSRLHLHSMHILQNLVS